MVQSLWPENFTTNYPQHIEIEVKRAPTDESIKLFKEMQEKALASIVDSGIFPNNLFEAKWVVYHDLFPNQYKAIVFFKLNGKEHRVDITIGSFVDRHKRIEICYEELIKYLSSMILMDVANTPSKSIQDAGGVAGYRRLIGQNIY